jgi:hypothetical protein
MGATARNFDGKRLDLMARVIPIPQRPALSHRARHWSKAFLFLLVPLALCASGRPGAQQTGKEIEEINTEFRFLGPDDALLIHEEEGRLKGQIDVYQNEDESDTVLSYILTIGSRKNDHVEFKTAKIHRKYYRFSGAVKRGSAHEEKDADYLRLVGELEIITVNADTGEESVERRDVVLKSLSADEISDQ